MLCIVQTINANFSDPSEAYVVLEQMPGPAKPVHIMNSVKNRSKYGTLGDYLLHFDI